MKHCGKQTERVWEVEDEDKGCGMPSSGKYIGIAIMNLQNLWITTLGRPVWKLDSGDPCLLLNYFLRRDSKRGFANAFSCVLTSDPTIIQWILLIQWSQKCFWLSQTGQISDQKLWMFKRVKSDVARSLIGLFFFLSFFY